jgi:SAM-dependent methyltransferase
LSAPNSTGTVEADMIPLAGRTNCSSCGSSDIAVFHRLSNVPANSCLLFSDREQARNYPRGEIVLGFCRNCGFISNLCFDSALTRYSEGYEEQQSFSPRFNEFARGLATGLIARHDLRNKTVVEIGCGKGDFLLLLCELGTNRGIGIDPTYVAGRQNSPASGQVTFIRDFYSDRYAQYTGDMVCCRHTLEHIPETGAFLQTIRRSIGKKANTLVFFELPDVQRVLDECAFWDIYYEHCSYFSLGSLARLFRGSGFEVGHLAKAYDGQYLLIEAKPANGKHCPPLQSEESIEELSQAVHHFQKRYEQVVSHWRRKVGCIREAGRRCVIWGSSSKCTAFLNTIGIADEIEFVVDINPHRQWKYLPGSGKLIVPPSFLREYRPDVVIAMNPIYLEEIRSDLMSMTLEPELMAL